MSIHDIMGKVMKWNNTLVGAGYKHPEYPNHHLEDDTRLFFKKYPELQMDKEYVEFIEYYSGLLTIYPNQELIITIYGLWSDYVTNILYPDEPLVDEDRFFNFASIVIDSTEQDGRVKEIGFAFDLHSDQSLPIYRQEVTGTQSRLSPQYTLYCDCFLDWLTQLHDSAGRLDI